MSRQKILYNLSTYLIGFLTIDILYLYYRLISDKMLILLYSSGLWVSWQYVLIFALFKTGMLGLVAFRTGFRVGLLILLIDASAGTAFALLDALQYTTQNCECSVMPESVWIKLGIRGCVLGILLYTWVSKRQ